MSSLDRAIATETGRQTYTTTENGALAYKTTGNSCLDLFASVVRDTDRQTMDKMVEKSFNENPRVTLAILMHLRDARYGKGEKNITYYALLWLRRNYPLIYLYNIKTFIELGYYKDLCLITKLVHTEKLDHLGEKTYIELEYFADLLKDDINKDNNISLVAKWAPSEGSFFDKDENGKQAKTIAKLLFPNDKACNKKYRKEVSALREKLKIVERLMAENRWDEIEFSHVPAKAHKILRNAFNKHQEERYKEYLQNVKNGSAKINTSGLQPHELANKYVSGFNVPIDDTIEVQWNALVNKLAEKGNLNSSVAVVDVSGSMSGQPMIVAIALGLLTSQLTDEPFRNHVITFTQTPKLHRVDNETLRDKINNIKRMDWGMNTNILAVFDLILGKAVEFNVHKDDMVKNIFIFTDMQFDKARDGPAKWSTIYDIIKGKYHNAGYDVPNMIFWNLRATKVSFQANKDTEGVAMVSGFSGELLKLFMDNSEFTPLSVMNLAIQPYIDKVRIN